MIFFSSRFLSLIPQRLRRFARILSEVWWGGCWQQKKNNPPTTPHSKKEPPQVAKNLAHKGYKLVSADANRYNVQGDTKLNTRGLPKLSEKRTRLIRELIETIAFTLLVFLIIRFAAQSFRVDGASMQPGLQTNEYVLVNKLAYLFHAPQRGDVIVFHDPLNPSQDFIKRVIGIPGDTIQTTSDAVIVDGQTLHEPYISTPFNYESNTLKLGSSEFFVMGDNRDNSFDSRAWGPLNQSYIVGKAVAVYWPLSDWQWVNTFSSVFASIGGNDNQGGVPDPYPATNQPVPYRIG
jgi:signal peptidase I